MSQLSEINRRIPYSNRNKMWWWDLILTYYPLSRAKIKIIANSNDKIFYGILIDHLMKVARKVNIPQVYIRNLGVVRRARKISKDKLTLVGEVYTKNEMIKQTGFLLEAVYREIQKNKSLIKNLTKER